MKKTIDDLLAHCKTLPPEKESPILILGTAGNIDDWPTGDWIYDGTIIEGGRASGKSDTILAMEMSMHASHEMRQAQYEYNLNMHKLQMELEKHNLMK